MTTTAKDGRPADDSGREPPRPPRYDSADLFGSASEVVISHDGALYRLRRTSLGKLILTK